MRVLVLGAGGARRTEASIVRAVRSLDHHCRFIDVVGWCRRLGPLAPPLVRRLGEAFRPEAVILTRHSRRLGDRILAGITQGRGRGSLVFRPQRATAAGSGQARQHRGTHLRHVSLPDGRLSAGRRAPSPLPPTRPRSVSRPSRVRLPPSDSTATSRSSDRDSIPTATSCCAAWPRSAGCRCGVPVGMERRPTFPWRVVRYSARRSPGSSTVRPSRSAPTRPARRTPRLPALPIGLWKVLGCGGFFLGPWQSGLEHFARDGRHCVWYRSPDDAVDLARHYLADATRRQEIAAAGREYALSRHTYAHRVDAAPRRGRVRDRGSRERSDDLVIPELEDPHSGQPLDRTGDVVPQEAPAEARRGDDSFGICPPRLDPAPGDGRMRSCERAEFPVPRRGAGAWRRRRATDTSSSPVRVSRGAPARDGPSRNETSPRRSVARGSSDARDRPEIPGRPDTAGCRARDRAAPPELLADTTAGASRRYRTPRRNGGNAPADPPPSDRRRVARSRRRAPPRHARGAPRRPGYRVPSGCLHARIARSVSTPSTVFRRVMSHSVSRMRILGSPIDRTSSSVSSSERPTLTTTSSHTGKIERMLASIGKSSLIAFLTMVKPDTLTTLPLPSARYWRPNFTRRARTGQARVGPRGTHRAIGFARRFDRARTFPERFAGRRRLAA